VKSPGWIIKYFIGTFHSQVAAFVYLDLDLFPARGSMLLAIANAFASINFTLGRKKKENITVNSRKNGSN
jgi:hypothetical protein